MHPGRGPGPGVCQVAQTTQCRQAPRDDEVLRDLLQAGQPVLPLGAEQGAEGCVAAGRVARGGGEAGFGQCLGGDKHGWRGVASEFAL